VAQGYQTVIPACVARVAVFLFLPLFSQGRVRQYPARIYITEAHFKD
jgi:hypothetical protein